MQSPFAALVLIPSLLKVIIFSGSLNINTTLAKAIPKPPPIDWSKFDFDIKESPWMGEVYNLFNKEAGFEPEHYYLAFVFLKRSLYALRPEAAQAVFVPHVAYLILDRGSSLDEAASLEEMLAKVGLLDDGEQFTTEEASRSTAALRAVMSRPKVDEYSCYSSLKRLLKEYRESIFLESDTLSLFRSYFTIYVVPHLLSAFRYAYPEDFEVAKKRLVAEGRKADLKDITLLPPGWRNKPPFKMQSNKQKALKVGGGLALAGGIAGVAYYLLKSKGVSGGVTTVDLPDQTSLPSNSDFLERKAFYIGAAALSVLFLFGALLFIGWWWRSNKGKNGGQKEAVITTETETTVTSKPTSGKTGRSPSKSSTARKSD